MARYAQRVHGFKWAVGCGFELARRTQRSRAHKTSTWNLIKLIKRDYGLKYNIAIAPGPNEIEDSKKFNTNIILNKSNPISIIELISLINTPP